MKRIHWILLLSLKSYLAIFVGALQKLNDNELYYYAISVGLLFQLLAVIIFVYEIYTPRKISLPTKELN